MRIRFLNPVEQVTGSCYWLSDDERRVEFLVDCGMVQGEAGAAEWNRRRFEFDPSKLACVFLTHSHVDHCGLLPRLAKAGFSGPVYCTRESAELARTALADAASRSDSLYTQTEVDRLNFVEPAGQLFGKLHSFGTDLYFGFYRTAHIVGGVAIQVVWGPKPVAGAPNTQRQITFSGDLGCNVEGEEHQPLLRYRMRPPPASFAVVESTYGATLRPPEEQDFDARIVRLKSSIDRAVFERQGVALIPCFASDRTQSVLFDLHYIFRADPDRYRDVPVYFHAPMAVRVNRIYAEALKRKDPTKANVLKPMWLNKRLPAWLGLDEAQTEAYLARILSSPTRNDLFYRDPDSGVVARNDRPFPDVIYTTITEAPRRLIKPTRPFGPAIFVTGGGMCDGGPVLSYFETLLRRDSTTLILTGYLPPSSIGGKLLLYAMLPPEERQRSSEWIEWPSSRGLPTRVELKEVVATVEKLSGYSGHADQRGLLDWLFSVYKDRPNLAGQTVFITHGTEDNRRALQRAIESRSAEWARLYPEEHRSVAVHLPKKHERDTWFDLDVGEWVTEEPEQSPRLAARVDALERRLAEIEALLRRSDTKQP